jgi:hypothetical protein
VITGGIHMKKRQAKSGKKTRVILIIKTKNKK